MHTFADSDSELSARPASDELAVRASAGLRWGAFNQGTQQIVRLAVQVVLTRLLAPEDFGAMAIALVVINVGTLIGALGFAQALVQRKQINRRDHHVSGEFHRFFLLRVRFRVPDSAGLKARGRPALQAGSERRWARWIRANSPKATTGSFDPPPMS